MVLVSEKYPRPTLKCSKQQFLLFLGLFSSIFKNLGVYVVFENARATLNLLALRTFARATYFSGYVGRAKVRRASIFENHYTPGVFHFSSEKTNKPSKLLFSTIFSETSTCTSHPHSASSVHDPFSSLAPSTPRSI